MKLLAGKTITVGEIPVIPFTLDEVAEIGYSEFQGKINIMLLTLDDMINSIDDFELSATLKANRHEYKVFDMYIASPEMSDVLIDSLSMIFRTNEIYLRRNDSGDFIITIDEKYHINRDNFDEISKVVEIQNNPDFSGEGEDDYNPANEVARSIAEKIREGKKKANESKAMESGGEGINLADMISAVSAMSNSINKLNIWDLTIYQLYDEFARISKIDNYRLQIQASMWGSDMEIEHWSEPL